MEFASFMDSLFNDDPAEPAPSFEADPAFDAHAQVIQDALAINGSTTADPGLFPDIFDTVLLELIDSVPLE